MKIQTFGNTITFNWLNFKCKNLLTENKIESNELFNDLKKYVSFPYKIIYAYLHKKNKNLSNKLYQQLPHFSQTKFYDKS